MHKERYRIASKKMASSFILSIILLMMTGSSLFAQVEKNELVKDQHAQIGAGEEESKEHTFKVPATERSNLVDIICVTLP
jgi:hypothetical protein